LKPNKIYHIEDNLFKSRVIIFNKKNIHGDYYDKNNLLLIEDKIKTGYIFIVQKHSIDNIELQETIGVVEKIEETGTVWFKIFQSKSEWIEIFKHTDISLFLSINGLKMVNNEIIITDIVCCYIDVAPSNWDFSTLYKHNGKWKIRRLSALINKNKWK